MYIRKLVKKYGFGIWVHCGIAGFMPIQVLEEVSRAQDGTPIFKVRHENDVPFHKLDWDKNFILISKNPSTETLSDQKGGV
jgi:hypothetical protein